MIRRLLRTVEATLSTSSLSDLVHFSVSTHCRYAVSRLTNSRARELDLYRTIRYICTHEYVLCHCAVQAVCISSSHFTVSYYVSWCSWCSPFPGSRDPTKAPSSSKFCSQLFRSSHAAIAQKVELLTTNHESTTYFLQDSTDRSVHPRPDTIHLKIAASPV